MTDTSDDSMRPSEKEAHHDSLLVMAQACNDYEKKSVPGSITYNNSSWESIDWDGDETEASTSTCNRKMAGLSLPKHTSSNRSFASGDGTSLSDASMEDCPCFSITSSTVSYSSNATTESFQILSEDGGNYLRACQTCTYLNTDQNKHSGTLCQMCGMPLARLPPVDGAAGPISSPPSPSSAEDDDDEILFLEALHHQHQAGMKLSPLDYAANMAYSIQRVSESFTSLKLEAIPLVYLKLLCADFIGFCQSQTPKPELTIAYTTTPCSQAAMNNLKHNGFYRVTVHITCTKALQHIKGVPLRLKREPLLVWLVLVPKDCIGVPLRYGAGLPLVSCEAPVGVDRSIDFARLERVLLNKCVDLLR